MWSRTTLPGLVTLALIVSACSSSSSTPAESTLPPAPVDVQVPVAFGLDRDYAGLQAAVELRSDPLSPSFGQWLTAAQIADQYGSSQTVAQNALDQLESAGFSGEIDPTRGVITGSMTVADAQQLLGVSLVVFTAGDGVTKIIGPTTMPKNGVEGIKGVSEVVGLTKTLPGPQDTSPTPSSSATAPSGCVDLPNVDYLTHGQFGLPIASGSATNAHLAMLEVDQVAPTVLDYLGRCYQLAVPQISVERVAGTKHLLPSSLESDLDLAVLAVADHGIRKISTYAFDPSISIVFPIAEVVRTSFEPEGPTILTTSVGFCEDDVSDPQLALGEWLLAAGSVGGLTSIAASGDNGSTACEPSRTTEETQYPASSAYVTGVGGSQFASTSDLARAQDDPSFARSEGSQVTWRSEQSAAGGGATTSRNPSPWYQKAAHKQKNRVVPDVAYLAAPFALSPLLLCNPTGACQRSNVGGTSAAAPGFAAAIARAAANLSPSKGSVTRLGLLNPSIYALVEQRNTATVDITVGDNDILGVGCCQAEPGYDAATGWGLVSVPDLEAFISQARDNRTESRR